MLAKHTYKIQMRVFAQFTDSNKIRADSAWFGDYFLSLLLSFLLLFFHLRLVICKMYTCLLSSLNEPPMKNNTSVLHFLLSLSHSIFIYLYFSNQPFLNLRLLMMLLQIQSGKKEQLTGNNTMLPYLKGDL